MTSQPDSAVSAEPRAVRLRFFHGGEKTVLVRDDEIVVPTGRLIVSRTDREGNITQVNDSFCEIAGYSRDELIGQPHSILRHPDMPRAAFRELWQTVTRGELWNGYVKNLCKDGRYYWVYATVIPNRRQGEIVGYTSVRREPSRAAVMQAAELYRTLE
jgi:PAS domain S-box-containing protein